MSGRKVDVLTRVLVMVWLAAAGGCANLGDQQNLPDDEAVRVRAQAWADALLDDDLKKAYAYTSPAYRSSSTLGSYNARVAGRDTWKAMEVKSVKCAEDVCDVSYTLEYRLNRANRLNTRAMDYRWIKVKGQWWLYVAAH